jgi:hypothetical protein
MYFPRKNTNYCKPKPKAFSDGKHHFEYTDKFKYLGCILMPDLLDDKEITKRVKQAKAQIASLNNFFKSKASLPHPTVWMRNMDPQ